MLIASYVAVVISVIAFDSLYYFHNNYLQKKKKSTIMCIIRECNIPMTHETHIAIGQCLPLSIFTGYISQNWVYPSLFYS